ncbi:MAG: tetratricopeptide repeat protein [Candidatus Margulisiibacteriota bacterium]
MNKTILILLLITTILIANEQTARNEYLNKNYQQSKIEYQKLVNAAPNNIAFQYNLGATFYRLGDFVNAKKHVLKALKISPTNQDIKFNLDIINKKFIDQNLSFKNHWAQFMGYSIPFILTLTLLCALPLFALLFYVTMTDARPEIKRPIILINLLWISIFFIAWGVNSKQGTYGLIISKKVSVYSGPSKTQNTLFYVHEGAEFKIESTSNKWYQIQFSNGLKGWIQGINIAEI